MTNAVRIPPLASSSQCSRGRLWSELAERYVFCELISSGTNALARGFQVESAAGNAKPAVYSSAQPRENWRYGRGFSLAGAVRTGAHASKCRATRFFPALRYSLVVTDGTIQRGAKICAETNICDVASTEREHHRFGVATRGSTNSRQMLARRGNALFPPAAAGVIPRTFRHLACVRSKRARPSRRSRVSRPLE